MASSGAAAVVADVELNRRSVCAETPNKARHARKRQGKPEPPAPTEPRVLKPGTKYQTEASRQEKLNYAQRTVWANLQRIIDSAIQQSLKQNYTAAKFLCEFAGVLAASDEEPESSTEKANAARGGDPMERFLTEVAETIGQ